MALWGSIPFSTRSNRSRGYQSVGKLPLYFLGSPFVLMDFWSLTDSWPFRSPFLHPFSKCVPYGRLNLLASDPQQNFNSTKLNPRFNFRVGLTDIKDVHAATFHQRRSSRVAQVVGKRGMCTAAAVFTLKDCRKHLGFKIESYPSFYCCPQ